LKEETTVILNMRPLVFNSGVFDVNTEKGLVWNLHMIVSMRLYNSEVSCT